MVDQLKKDLGRFRGAIPLIPRGVQCYFGEEVNRRRRVEAILAAIARNWGFHEIILPFFDYLEDFVYGLGSQLGDRVYRFLDKDGSLLALRPDLTTLVAKTVATRMTDHPIPVQLFYSGEVFRQERAGAGKQKEFYQIGLESMGVSDIWADIEIILIAIDCLLHLGVEEFKIALGNVGLFNGIVSGLDVSHEKLQALRDAVDHRDSSRLETEVADLRLSDEKKSFLVELPQLTGGREVVERAIVSVRNPRSRRSLRELSEIHSVVESLGLERFLTLDLGEVRGLDYYTGMVFKIYSSSGGFELGGGGRYDDLLAKFGWNLPSVGFSFTLDHVLPLIGETGNLEIPACPGEPRVLRTDGVASQEIFTNAWRLRREGNCIQLGVRS
ncbi:MAG: phosphoribosyltransferase regulatory subunit [Acidobacteria bacterium]|jgi:ATP phosphoribosyltransferase regulatory subunit|nr:phosphoribosyltransferase regulatory subunit [Acidobacteriota bacterium]